MRHPSRLILTLIVLLALSGCQLLGLGFEGVSDEDLITVSYPRVAREAADPRDHAVIVDVRPAQQYRTGHLPGAVNVPLPDLNVGHPRLQGMSTVYVYDRGWGVLAPAAAKKLISQGRKRVLLYRPGLEGWTERGGPVVAERDRQ